MERSNNGGTQHQEQHTKTNVRDSFVAENSHNASTITTITTTIPTITHNITLNTSLDSLAGLSLAAVLSGTKPPSQPNTAVVRTLLDIIKNEETLNSPIHSNHYSGKTSWKSFKDRLNIKRVVNSGAKWRSSFPVPCSDLEVPNTNREIMMMVNNNGNRNSLSRSIRDNSLRADGVPADDMALREIDGGGELVGSGSMRLSARLEAERQETRKRLSRELVRKEGGEEEVVCKDNDEHDEEGGEGSDSGGGRGGGANDDDNGGIPGLFGGGGGGGEPIRMSLMDLLEETDRQAGIEGPTYRFDDEEEEEEVAEEEEDNDDSRVDEDGGKGEVSCCVCMVKHKGGPFIPCGHTFCKLCSKELWVQKGNCPLCNNFILEVLDIF